MMLDPACLGGRLISLSPALGPLDSRRRSLHILESFTATRFSTPETCTKAPASWVASTRFCAVTNLIPVISASRWQTSAAYSGCAMSFVGHFARVTYLLALAPVLATRSGALSMADASHSCCHSPHLRAQIGHMIGRARSVTHILVTGAPSP